MNYTELKDAVRDTVEVDIPDAVLDMLTRQAEQTLYNSVQLPAMRKNVTAAMTANNKYLGTPADFLFPYSLAVVDSSGDYQYLLNKDVNFIREAYPDPALTGVPKYYAIFDDDTFILGPMPDLAYTTELHYAGYPESIVTAGTTWLGTNFDTALLNGTLIQAIRFIKGEQADVQLYETLYAQAVVLLKQLADGKLRQDAYRSGQVRVQVK